ncbi:MAG: dihydropteroate synthase [Anaerolineales bacterium]|nr:dihydropteroate synthase [Anaerolineales bacterium]
MSTLKSTALRVNQFTFEWGKRTYLMGILNITPDSFSGDGLLAPAGTPQDPGAPLELTTERMEAILDQARHQVAGGADILDVGGESTRPGALPLDAAEELRRVLPVIRAIKAEMDVLVSVDTYRAAVADVALQVGANLVNDVWGFKVDPELAQVAASHGAPVILMHNRSSWAHAEIKERLGGRYVGIPYEDLMKEVCAELMESVAIAHQAGVPDEHILLDPGIGFGKSVEQNLELVDRLDEIRALGYPLLLGPSRKSFIGYTLNLPPEQRLEGTAAAVAVGITRGADVVRVHDVEAMTRVARMTDAIVRRQAA